MLPNLASLSLNGSTCRPCRRAAGIGAMKQDFLDNAKAGFEEEVTCSACQERLEKQTDVNEAPPWARSPKFRAAVFGPGKSSENLVQWSQWSVVKVCNYETPHVMHLGCAHKWFAAALAQKRDPSCPECRQPYDKDLLEAFIDNDPALHNSSILSEPDELTVEYFDFEYEQARRAVAAAEARGLGAINWMWMQWEGEEEVDLEAWAGSYGEQLRRRLDEVAHRARENLDRYRVRWYDLEQIEPGRLLQGVNQIALTHTSQRAMNAAAAYSIQAYMLTEASMMLSMQRPQWSGVEFHEKDLIRPVMQYYFFVCSALKRLCPNHFVSRYEGVEGGDFDRTTQRGFYLRYPSNLPYPHDTERVTEQRFFRAYPDSVVNPYQVESTYHVSFLVHRLQKQVEGYADAYKQFSSPAERILRERDNPVIDNVIDVGEVGESMDSTVKKFLDRVHNMEQCAAEALEQLRKEAGSPSLHGDIITELVARKLTEFELSLFEIANLVTRYAVPNGEKIMRKRKTIGAKPNFSSSKVFFEMARVNAEIMRFFFYAGLRSLAEDCNDVVKDAVTQQLDALENAARWRGAQAIPASDSDSGAGRDRGGGGRDEGGEEQRRRDLEDDVFFEGIGPLVADGDPDFPRGDEGGGRVETEEEEGEMREGSELLE